MCGPQHDPQMKHAKEMITAVLKRSSFSVCKQVLMAVSNLFRQNNTKIYLNVPYEEKEHAKSLGAKWNPKKKKWYSMNNNEHF